MDPKQLQQIQSPTSSTEWSPGKVNIQVPQTAAEQFLRQVEEYEQQARAKVELELELERRKLWEQEQEKQRRYWQARRGNEWWWNFEQPKECEEEDKRRQCWEQEQGCEQRTQETRTNGYSESLELGKVLELGKDCHWDWTLLCGGMLGLRLRIKRWPRNARRRHEREQARLAARGRKREWVKCDLEWVARGQALREYDIDYTFSRIFRLSTWKSTLANNRKMAVLMQTAIDQFNQFHDDEESHAYLRQFMDKHHVLCAFILSRTKDITSDESKRIANLCNDLRKLALRLRNNAVKKAEGYERLYNEFVANREGLSVWLNSAGAGLGRSLVDSFTSNLKHMAASMRSEANFWGLAAGTTYDWQDIRHKYTSAIDAMPSFPPDQANTSHTLPIEVPAESNPENLGQVAQRVSTSFNDLKTALVATQPKVIQKFLAKTGQSITKRFDETEGYLKLAKDTAEKQLSPHPQEELSKSRLMTVALQVAKSWKELYLRVKYGASILSLFSKPFHALTLLFPPDEPQLQLSSSDYYARGVATLGIAAKKCHPCLIDCEVFLWSMCEHFWSLVRICDDCVSIISSSGILGSSTLGVTAY